MNYLLQTCHVIKIKKIILAIAIDPPIAVGKTWFDGFEEPFSTEMNVKILETLA